MCIFIDDSSAAMLRLPVLFDGSVPTRGQTNYASWHFFVTERERLLLWIQLGHCRKSLQRNDELEGQDNSLLIRRLDIDKRPWKIKLWQSLQRICWLAKCSISCSASSYSCLHFVMLTTSLHVINSMNSIVVVSYHFAASIAGVSHKKKFDVYYR